MKIRWHITTYIRERKHFGITFTKRNDRTRLEFWDERHSVWHPAPTIHSAIKIPKDKTI